MTSSTPSTSGQPSQPVSAQNSEPIKGFTGSALLPNRWLALAWRSILIVICLTGIILNSIHLGFLPQLVFFTTQSNLFLAAYLAYALWCTTRKNGELAPALAGAATLYILITGLVYNFVLAKSPILLTGSPATILLHFCAPIMATLDWLLLVPHGRLSWRRALHWLSYPLAYLAFALIRGPFVAQPPRYPYPFVNVDLIGYGSVALNTLIYGLAFWLLGLLLIALDHILSRRPRQRRHMVQPSS